MSTKSTTVKLTTDEVKYNRRVKSIELAIKSSGNKGVLSDTVIKVAEKIYTYLNL